MKRRLALIAFGGNALLPAFAGPATPVGPFDPRFRAQALAREKKWKMIEDTGRGWREVLITSAAHLKAALLKRSGTRVVAAQEEAG